MDDNHIGLPEPATRAIEGAEGDLDHTITCLHCGLAKPADLFTRDRHQRDGRRHTCKACTKLRWPDNGSARHHARKARPLVVPLDGMLYCSKCRTTLPLSSFTKDRSRPSGMRHTCRECNRQWRPTDPVKRRAYAKVYFAIPANFEKRRMRSSAWAKNHPERAAAHGRAQRARKRLQKAQGDSKDA